MTSDKVTSLDDHRPLPSPNDLPAPPPPNDPQLAESIRQGEAAVVLYRSIMDKGRDLILPMAHGLADARRAYRANQEFGAWLGHSPYCDIEKDDRAALIKIAEHAAFATKFIKATRYVSPRMIWNTMRELLPSSHDAKTAPVVDKDPQTTENAASEQATATDAPAPPPATAPETGRTQRVAPHRSPLHSLYRVEDVLAVITHKDTRTTLNKLKERRDFAQIWGLILKALDAGLIQPSNTKIAVPNLRLLFPFGSGRFYWRTDLTDKKTRDHVSSTILPLMIAHKEALFAAPQNLEQIIADAQRKQVKDQQTAVLEGRTSRALAAMPADEQEVIMFGQRMWPLVPGETIGTYDFRTLQVAIWKFTDLNRWLMLGDKSAHGRAIMIRNSTKWDRHFIGELTKGTDIAIKIDRIYSLVHALCSLMEQHPDGECKEPMTPLVLG